MWLMLALAVVVCVAVLYVPGYLFARSLFVSRFASVAIAPMISIFFLAVLGIVDVYKRQVFKLVNEV